jgi:hypothetical protein
MIPRMKAISPEHVINSADHPTCPNAISSDYRQHSLSCCNTNESKNKDHEINRANQKTEPKFLLSSSVLPCSACNNRKSKIRARKRSP